MYPTSFSKKFKRATGLLLVVGFGLGSQACTGAEAGFALAAGATATIIQENKFPTDLLGDIVTGKDCNTIRKMEDGGPLCRSKDYGKVIEKPTYCYRTLGEHTCYSRPDPNR